MASLLPYMDRPKFRCRSIDTYNRGYQIFKKLFIDLEMPFIFSHITALMTFGKGPPNCCVNAQCMR